MNFKVLNKKQIKKIFSLIKEQWDADVKIEHVFLQDNDEKLYITNRDISRIDLSRLRINSIGMYFGLIRNNELRLSIEASQMIGAYAKKNIVDLHKKDAARWLAGEDLDYSGNETGFALIKHNDDFLGTGKIKEGRILNFIPKARRLKSTDII